MIPQLIVITLAATAIGMTMQNHGNYKKGKDNMWHTIVAQILLHATLYWGGFYDVIFSK